MKCFIVKKGKSKGLDGYDWFAFKEMVKNDCWQSLNGLHKNKYEKGNCSNQYDT